MPAQSYWGAAKPPVGTLIDRGHPLASLLGGYWPLGDGGVWDATGSPPLLKAGSPGLVPGRSSSTIFSSAAPDYLYGTARDSVHAGPPGFTIAIWASLDSLANVTLASRYEINGNRREWLLFYNLNDHVPNNVFSLSVSGNGTTNTVVDATSFGTPTVRLWNLVVGWYDGVNINIQVNNGPVNSVAYSSGVFSGSGNTAFGVLFNNFPTTVYPLNGRLDSAAFWRRPLLAAERTLLYAEPYAMFAPPAWRRYFKVSSVYALTLAGTVTPTGALVKSVGTHVAGSVTPAGVLVKSPGLHFAGAVTPAGTLTRSAGKTLAGTVTPAGALVKQVGRHLAGVVTPAGALVKSVGSHLAGSVTPAGALVKRVGKTLAGTLTPAGALTNLRQAQVALSGTVTPVGVLALTAFAHGSVRVFGGAVNALVTILTTGRQRPDVTVQTGDKQSGA